MSHVWRLKVWTRFLASPEAVWRLKTDPIDLAKEFWPWVWLSMSTSEQASLSDALSSDDGVASVTTRLLPTGMRWDMDVEVLEHGVAYRDRSSNRLFRKWEHTHRLFPASDATLYVDDVRFVPAKCAKAVASLMRRLFEHRHRRSAKMLPAEQGSVGVSMLRLDVPACSG